MALPVVLGVASALGLLLSYWEIGPTSFRIAIFSCIIAGFVAALFQRRSSAQVERVVAEERQARLAAARELREEMASLSDAIHSAQGSAVDLDPVRAELASLSGKVSALEQSQSTFRDSLVQEMNPGRGRRRGRSSDPDASRDYAATAAANGSAGYETSAAISTAASYPASFDSPAYDSATYESGAYQPTNASSSYAPGSYPSSDEPALARRSWSGADALSTPAQDEADTADYGSADYSGYGNDGREALSSATADRRLAEIFPPPERGRDAGTGRPSWTSGAATNGYDAGYETGSGNGANGHVGDVSPNPYNDAFASATTNGMSDFTRDAGEATSHSSSMRSALWESSAASRLAAQTGAASSFGAPSPAVRGPWQPEADLQSRPVPGGRSATPWEPQAPESHGRTPWSESNQLSDDEDPVAAAVRHGSPRRGRPTDEDPHEATQTQRLSASEQTAIRRRFLDLSSMDEDGWQSRRP